jgi:hypothetical protein
MTRFYHSSISSCRLPSTGSLLSKSLQVALFCLTTFFLNSCEEGPTNIGEGMLPGSDFVAIKSIDTLSIRSFTMYDDSVRTNNPAISYLGEIYDPYFGTTTAEFITQIRMAEPWDDKFFVVDSVKLFIKFASVEGSTNVTHKLHISEIKDQIYLDSAYYSNRVVKPGGYDMPDLILPVLKKDTINNVIITLPKAFGQYILRDTSMLFHSNTKPDFRSYFKGLYFRITSSPNPVLLTVNLEPPTTFDTYKSYIIIYMTGETGAAKEFYFILDAINKNASFNRFTHNFNTALPGKKIQHINDGFIDSLSYLQYLNGVYTKISLPGLATLKNDPKYANISVNKARITVPVQFDGSLYKASTAPPRLRLRYKTSANNKYDVPDYFVDQYSAFFDGSLDTTKAVSVYHFNIASFVQAYLRDEKGLVKPELEIFQGSGTRNVILKANNSKIPVKFDFSYTKF